MELLEEFKKRVLEAQMKEEVFDEDTELTTETIEETEKENDRYRFTLLQYHKI